MTMSKGLVSYIEGKVSELKVMCGLSLESPACEERAIKSVKPDPIPINKFMTVYRQRKRSGQLAVEFKALQRNQDEHSTTAALRNVLLNNKQDVLPYDHSRVIILNPNEPNDYYNASYIDGYNAPREYIASQGPSTKNMLQFWYMVWQENVSCIVMATGLFENAVQQCDKYWVDHARNVAIYGNVKVWHEHSTCLAQLNIRTFRIQKEGSCETRVLHQFEMVGLHEEFPDSGLLLDVRRRVHALTHNQPGATLVHCRCGGGRSAVYVALDYCLHQLQSEDRVDVYSAVLHLRRFRKNMVRTVTQYQQIYDAVTMFIQCGVTVHPSETLPSAFQLHYASDKEEKSQKLDREFQTLQSIVPRLSIGDCASGHRVENRSKSRDIMMLPPECARPYLNTADCGDSGTDFINAVYVDGYHALNRYLVTQWPMKRTLSDIWRLLFDFKITSLVVMNDLKKFSRSYPRFWPKEVDQIVCYGPISVRYISCERRPDLVIRTFAIRKTLNNLIGCELRRDEIIVKMFQVLGVSSSGSRRTAYTTSNGIDPGGGSGGDCGDGHLNQSRYRYRRRRRRRRRHRHDSIGSSSCLDSPQHTSDGILNDRAHKTHQQTSSSLLAGKFQKSLKRGVSIHSKSLLATMELVDDWQQRSLSRQPVCVMSKNGSSDAGLFCTISICCDQLKAEKEVDVFNAVRYVRCNRPHLVPTLEEYRFIYQFMAALIKMTKSKPDIIVSKPFPAFFASPTDIDIAHYTATSTNNVSSSIHGGVYVTKLEDKTGMDSGMLTLPVENYNNNHNTSNIHHSHSSGIHFNANSTKHLVGKANSYPLNTSLSASHMSSLTHDPINFNIITEPLSFSSSNHQRSPDVFNTSELKTHVGTPDSIHASSFSTAVDITPDATMDLNCSQLENNLLPSANGFLSPNSYLQNNARENLNSASSLCKSSSFYSCDSDLSDNGEDSEIYRPNFENAHPPPAVKPLEDPLGHPEGAGSTGDSYSTLKDFPTEDTSISFQLDCDDSHSNNTSCPSIVDSCNGANATDLSKERNNNCQHKTESGANTCSAGGKTDRSRKNPKKSKWDKWSFSLPKVFGWKKK